MTCIVGIEHRGLVYLGGDSAGTTDRLDQLVLGDKKVFRKGDFVFGVCGLPKVMDVLRDTLELPKQAGKDENRKFITNDLVPAIRDALKRSDCTEEHEGQDAFHGLVLFGYSGKLYRLEGNFQVITTAYGFDSVGSGASIALGSLHATKRADPQRRILKALEASAINNAAVRPPFTIVSTKRKRGRLF